MGSRGEEGQDVIRGYLHPDFWPVARQLEKQLRASRRGGAAVCIYHRDQCVADIWGGYRNERGDPWEEDTLALSFSTTKGVASTALHVLVDRGLLDYDDPVAKHWPEFACNEKERITVRQVLCHEAGLYGLRTCIDRAERMYDWDYMVAALAAAAPAHAPGSANAYHGLSFGWLVGELIRRVSGKPISAVVQAEIAEPLGLDGLYIGTPPAQHHRGARIIQAKHMRRSPDRLKPAARVINRLFRTAGIPVDLARSADALLPQGMEELDWSSPRTWSCEIPAANGLFTARSLARMYAALAAGGELDGVRLISEETLRRATEVQNRRVDLVVPFPMHWRLGYHRVATTRGMSRRGFGHYGFGGSGAFADPDRHLAFAMVLNSGLGTPFGDLRTVRMAGVALLCADRR
jgi:CubicO group peptidase (beta-lactamase class C family)